MIKGIGTDLVRTSRIANSLERFGERFAEKILASKEMTDFKSSKDKVKFLSKRFAAKEAVAKALGTGMGAGVHFKSIEVTHKLSGSPEVVLHGAAQRRANKLGVTDTYLSVTDEQ
ncbi:MAG: holo-ACP synthase, partial [Pseudomonadales bacterium]|nr:holo-ACP synthase [Pseudomonadales bacterium]